MSGSTIKRGFVEKIVALVNGLKADLIAVTGDLVDGSVQQSSAHTAPLAGLAARHGAYFVTGNHEYYSGERAWTAEIRRLGLRVLKNEHVVLRHQGASLVLAGVTDLSAHHFDAAQHSDPAAALRGSPADAGAKILLAHQPNSAPAAAGAGFDVQLSGHTHGGQFWPWNLFVGILPALHGRSVPIEESMGVRQPRYRLLGAAESLRRAIGNHPHPARSRDTLAHRTQAAASLVLEFDRRMRAVAEGLVLRGPAPAQGHAIANLVVKPIRAGDLNSAPQPHRSRTLIGGIFDQTDGWLMVRLERFSRGIVPGDQPA